MANSHLNFGVETYIHKGKTIISPVGNPQYDAYIGTLKDSFSYELGFIPAGYAHRPDRISALFYGTPDLWWLLLLVNNISDPLQSLNEGDQLLIPRL